MILKWKFSVTMWPFDSVICYNIRPKSLFSELFASLESFKRYFEIIFCLKRANVVCILCLKGEQMTWKNKRNCIPLYIQSLEIGPYELQCIIEDFILQHFESLVAKKHSRKICDLNRAQLCKLLASEKLLVTSEATVYKAVFQWVRLIYTKSSRSCCKSRS